MWTDELRSFRELNSTLGFVGYFFIFIMDTFVKTMLTEWGFEFLIQNFRAKNIDTETFLGLTKASNRRLARQLCLNNSGHTAALLGFIQRFNAESGKSSHDMKTKDG